MLRISVLISCCFILSGCSKVETTPFELGQTNLNENVVVLPVNQENTSLKPVSPNIKLDAKQEKYLNESLPPNVREILEKAEKFEVLAEVREEEFDESDDSFTFEANRIAKITKNSDKKEILEAFYHDAAREDALSACYYPYHRLRATYENKTVEVEICFKCSKFIVESPFGNFYGIIVRDNRKSENVLNRIIQNQGVEFKQ
jgi:hypothetical protein